MKIIGTEDMSYFYEDFTEKNYHKLLVKIKEVTERKFIPYENFEQDKPSVLLRHDIDFSVHRAHHLAQIEQMNGVRSTYFVYLHSEFYHALEKEIVNLLKEIREMGHYLGLHFCGNEYYGNLCKKPETLEILLKKEKELLEYICECKIDVFSFHNPSQNELTTFRQTRYAEMINTYSDAIKNKYDYCSDSNGYWRFQRLEEFIEKYKGDIQILCHPVWWTPEVLSPFQRIQRAAEGRRQNQIKHYLEALKISGRKNIL